MFDTIHREIRDVYDRYADDLLSLAMNLLHDPHLAEDVVHDVFLRFFQRPPRLRRQSKTRAYLVTCVVNRARDVFRQRQNRSTEPWSDSGDRLPTQVSPLHLVEEEDLKHRAFHALNELPYEQREVVLLKLQHDMTFRQIARLQAVSLKTAASRYRYALEKLQTSMNGQVRP